MTWPDLSIVIYSAGDPGGCVRLLTDCERLEHEGFELEIILVVQGLTEKVQQMLKDYPFSFKPVFVAAPEDSSRAVGRNLGVEQARFEHILFLDSDLEVTPELLYNHLASLAEPGTVAVMGEIFLPKFVKKSRWFRFLDSDYRSTRRWSRTSGTQLSPPLRYVNTSNFSIRKDRYLKSGGHGEEFGHTEAEDIDLAHRISALKEGDIRFQPHAVAFRQHPSLKDSLKSKYQFGKKGIPALLKSYPDLYHVLSSRFVSMAGYSAEKPVLRMLTRLLFIPPVFFMARGIRLLSPEFVAFRMMRYMLQYESVRGVRESI